MTSYTEEMSDVELGMDYYNEIVRCLDESEWMGMPMGYVLAEIRNKEIVRFLEEEEEKLNSYLRNDSEGEKPTLRPYPFAAESEK
jgi:hypothetical protein